MRCKHCGAPFNGNDKFCRNCGAPKRFALGKDEKEKAFWRHGWFTILMLFMCFPVGVILVFINHPSIVKTFMGLRNRLRRIAGKDDLQVLCVPV